MAKFRIKTAEDGTRILSGTHMELIDDVLYVFDQGEMIGYFRADCVVSADKTEGKIGQG